MTNTSGLALLSLLAVGLSPACAPTGDGTDAEGEEGEGEEGEGEEGEGEGEEGEGEEGEGEGEGVVVVGANAATAGDGSEYVFENVIEIASVDGRVAYEAADVSGYWSVKLDVPDSPGSYACNDGDFVFIFSDFFTPFSSEHAEASCGIEVTSAPYTHGGRLAGTYQGTFVNPDAEPPTRSLTGNFDATVRP